MSVLKATRNKVQAENNLNNRTVSRSNLFPDYFFLVNTEVLMLQTLMTYTWNQVDATDLPILETYLSKPS